MHEQRILVAVLNWGLGHATRMQVLIREWLDQGKDVWIAADGDACEYLKQRFPQCTFVDDIPASHVHYDTHQLSKWRWYRGALQMHQLMLKDHRRCAEIVATHQIDLIVSDSRLGFYSKHVKSVMVTHQLTPIWPKGMARWGQYYLDRCLKRFQELWVPDREDHIFSGALSCTNKGFNIRFLGPLSRFKSPTISRTVY
ncbi:MAG: glycosyltransferase family protein, partial [Flavobacteriales bacterium]